tara:strand:- start:1062 stop:2006 length:945 start_codon:yes stop_codon:yes gene_type:complete
MKLTDKVFPFFIIVFLVTLSCVLQAQDTVRIGKSYHYTTEEVNHFSGKGFRGHYGQENIIFSANHIKVEYCYYTENKRICYGSHYRIINDSTLSVGDSIPGKNDQVWNFKRLKSGNYAVSRIINDFLESGIVDTLIPLKPIAPFLTTSIDLSDTLWESYQFSPLRNASGSFYTINSNVNLVQEKVYEYDQIDTPPLLLNGDTLPIVAIDRISYCYNEPMTFINTVTCIVTKEGKIKNVEQALGGLPDNCDYTMMEIIREIYTWGKLQPATRNGEPVNVRWFIYVDDLSTSVMHPAYLDSDKNRKKFLQDRKMKG